MDRIKIEKIELKNKKRYLVYLVDPVTRIRHDLQDRQDKK